MPGQRAILRQPVPTIIIRIRPFPSLPVLVVSAVIVRVITKRLRKTAGVDNFHILPQIIVTIGRLVAVTIGDRRCQPIITVSKGVDFRAANALPFHTILIIIGLLQGSMPLGRHHLGQALVVIIAIRRRFAAGIRETGQQVVRVPVADAFVFRGINLNDAILVVIGEREPATAVIFHTSQQIPVVLQSNLVAVAIHARNQAPLGVKAFDFQCVFVAQDKRIPLFCQRVKIRGGIGHEMVVLPGKTGGVPVRVLDLRPLIERGRVYFLQVSGKGEGPAGAKRLRRLGSRLLDIPPVTIGNVLHFRRAIPQQGPGIIRARHDQIGIANPHHAQVIGLIIEIAVSGVHRVAGGALVSHVVAPFAARPVAEVFRFAAIGGKCGESGAVVAPIHGANGVGVRLANRVGDRGHVIPSTIVVHGISLPIEIKGEGHAALVGNQGADDGVTTVSAQF